MSKFEENNLTQIKENSGISGGSLTEASSSGDIATTQDFISALIDEKYNDSLAYNIAEVQVLGSSWGSVYANTRTTDNDFNVVRTDIYTKLFKIKTGFTAEVWQDMINMFKSKAINQAGKILSGLSSQDENLQLIQKLDQDSTIGSSINISTTNSTENITGLISAHVAESVLLMNRNTFKTLEAFCVVPLEWAAKFLGVANFVTSNEESKNKRNSLFVGRIGKTDFYVNPFSNAANEYSDDYNQDYTIDKGSKNYCYVGLKSKVPGESSLIFAPYQYELQTVTDPDTLDRSLFLYNRYGLIVNPQHDRVNEKSMLYKFEIISTI